MDHRSIADAIRDLVQRTAEPSGRIRGDRVANAATQNNGLIFQSRRQDAAKTVTRRTSGILWWAIGGYERLQENGKFTEPAASIEMAEELDRVTSPIGAFIADCCVVDDARTVRSADLYDAWCKWCKEEGIEKPGSRIQFFKKLRASSPAVSSIRTRNGDRRDHSYRGLALRGDSFV